jgi:hypothetical protein
MSTAPSGKMKAMTRGVALLWAAMLAGWLGCGPVPATSGASESVRERATLVEMRRSGGLTGATTTLRVTRAGIAVARPGGRRVTLTPRKLRALRKDLDAARIGTLPRPRQGSAADGYLYELAAAGDRAVVVQGDVPGAARPLLARLTRLLSRSLRG